MDRRTILLEIIENYKNLPELWDTNHKNYSNRDKKGLAYDNLTSILKKIEPDASRNSVVRKINSLRSNFRKEFKKVNDSKRSGKSTDEIYKPSLWYFKEFSFLIDQDTPEESRSTINLEDYDEENKNETSENVDVAGTSLECKENENVKTPSITRATKRKRGSNVAEDMFAYALKQLEKEDDEYMITSKVYAHKLKNMDSVQRICADRLINDVLAEEQLGQLTKYSCIGNRMQIHSFQPSTSTVWNVDDSTWISTPSPQTLTVQQATFQKNSNESELPDIQSLASSFLYE